MAARALVSAQWLHDAIKSNRLGPQLRILDSSWYLPKLKRDAAAEFRQKHIPGTYFFDLDECSDKTSSLDHMLPTKDHFAEYVSGLGIGNDTHVVVYDASDFGSYSAPRVWWMFRLFGHQLVSVLDGGMKKWLHEGRQVTSEFCPPERQEFKATISPSWIKTYDDILKNIETKQFQVIDARSADTKPGHFPGAINMPFTSFMDASGTELEPDQLRKLFQEAGVDLERPLWASCGSGVTACHVVLAAHLLGAPPVSVYDGSWAEWYKRAATQHVLSEGKYK